MSDFYGSYPPASGGGASPTGPINAVQTNDGAGGLSGDKGFEYDGSYVKTLDIHIQSGQTTAPLVTVLSNAGTGATVAANTVLTDVCGTIQLNVGTGATAGNLINVKFDTAYDAPPVVLISCGSSDAAKCQPYVSSVAATGFVIASFLSPSNKPVFDYWVVQTK
jgi:hypothetical protein